MIIDFFTPLVHHSSAYHMPKSKNIFIKLYFILFNKLKYQDEFIKLLILHYE